MGSLTIDIDGHLTGFPIISTRKVMPFFAFDNWPRIDVKYLSLIVVSVEESKTSWTNFDMKQTIPMFVADSIKQTLWLCRILVVNPGC